MELKTRKETLFGINFDSLSLKETEQLVMNKIRKKQAVHLLGMNADKINELNRDKRYKEIVENAEIINADGVSVVIAAKILGKNIPERVAGIDLMNMLLRSSEERKLSVFFLGAKKQVLEKMLGNFKVNYPHLIIAGYRDGYFLDDQWEDVADTIEKSLPDIVFIGITSPKKEYLVDFFIKRKIHSVFMGVGGSFDVLAGEVKRAPVLLQKVNLEWLYRMLQEPKRLFGRYFFGNIQFMGLVIKEWLKLRKKEKNDEKV